MNEEPHAHETLVAKVRRHGSEGSISAASVNIDTQPLAPATTGLQQNANGTIQWGIYLLEPLILMLLFGYNFSSTVLKNQIIYQTCTSWLDYTDAECMLLGTKNATNATKKIEAVVQPYAAQIFLTMKIVECIVPALCGLFVGAWADRYGRKPLLMASFLGYSLQYLMSAGIAQQAMERHGMVSPWFYVLTVIPLACLGSSITYSVAAVCFISDVSTGKARSYRMIAYELSMYVGLMLGAYSSGYVYEATNAYMVFAISALVILCAFFIIVFFLPESLPATQRLDSYGSTAPATTSTSGSTNPTFWSCNKLIQLLKEFWHTCVRTRDFKDRSIIILSISILLLSAFVNDGSNSVFYLFIRERFHWTVRQFTSYESVSILVPAVAGSGGIFILWLLRKCTNSSVWWLTFISLVSHVASSLCIAFAFVDWQIYLAIGAGALKSLSNPMCRTVITNLLPADERGKVFSMLSVLQSLIPFASSTLYIVIYSITLISYPGFFNFVSANVFGLAIILLLIVWRQKSTNHSHYEPVFK